MSDSYLRTAGEFFLEKRRQGGMLSPKDWLIIEQWQREEIPLRSVLKGIEEALGHLDWPNSDKMVSLKYCERFVKAAASEAG
ncbi:MAG: hypothetical protein ACE5GM_01140 [bacterium]